MQIGRKEVLLAVGLTVALAVALSGQTTGVLPGLALMAASLLLYIQSGRRDLEAKAAALAEHARLSQAHARERERLVEFWQALTQALDLDAIREVARRYLPEITGSPGGWIVTGAGSQWTCILGPETVQTTRGEMKVTDLAVDALGQPGIESKADGIDYEGQTCFPMIAAGESLGVVGVPAEAPPLAAVRRPVIGGAAALLGVAVRSARLLQDVRENSLRDLLTGCVTRAHALDVLVSDLKRARRSRLPVSLIMIDVDHFKSINDRHGHLCGDEVLAAVGARIRATLRLSDLKCRYGGEEFMALLPETSIEGAKHVAESLRRDLSELEIPWNGQTIRVTASFGVATARTTELDPTPLIARADEALYRAKHDGRNCIRVAESTDAATPDSR